MLLNHVNSLDINVVHALENDDVMMFFTLTHINLKVMENHS